MSVRWLLPPILAGLWLLLTGSLSLANLLFGLVVGLAALWLVRDVRVPSDIRVRPLRLLRLVGLFLVELIRSAVRVLVLALSPHPRLSPGFIVVPLTVEREFEIALLANLITLTPGTLSVDLSADHRQLTIHCLEADDPEAIIAAIRTGFEARILEAFR